MILKWADLLTAQVEAGETVHVRSSSGIEPEWMRQCLLGPVFGMLLHQKKYLVLHASAIEVDGKAVLLLGDKGAGKSTMAAVMHQRGHTLFSDDVVAIDLSTGAPLVLPGTAQIRLWPDSAGAARLELNAGHAIHSDVEKRVWNVGPSRTERIPLSTIVALSFAGVNTIQHLPNTAAFSVLIEHLYARRFVGAHAVVDRFQDCAMIAATTPVVHFSRRRDLKDLTAQAELLERALEARPPRSNIS